MEWRQVGIDTLLHIKFIATSYGTHLWGSITGILLFLMGKPSAALYGLGALILIDIATRLRANAIKYGGYIQATKTGKIRSKLVVQGLMSKMIAYFSLICIGNIASYIVPIPMIHQGISSVIFTILFFVESQSILENLLDAEPLNGNNRKFLNLLLLKFKKEMENVEKNITVTEMIVEKEKVTTTVTESEVKTTSDTKGNVD